MIFGLCSVIQNRRILSYNNEVKFMENAFSMTFSTIFCIGFGDVFPKTYVGG